MLKTKKHVLAQKKLIAQVTGKGELIRFYGSKLGELIQERLKKFYSDPALCDSSYGAVNLCRAKLILPGNGKDDVHFFV